MNPKLYRKQISEIGIEDMVIDISSLERSMQTMSELDELESILSKIRYNLHLDIRNLRVEYMQRMQEAEEMVNQRSIFGRRKTTEDVVKKKRELKKERNADIATYEIIEDLINSYLNQIEESRVYIRNHIQTKVQ